MRGEEVVKPDFAGFILYFETGRDHMTLPHVMLPLVGRFKGETGERWHLLPMAWETRSGITTAFELDLCIAMTEESKQRCPHLNPDSVRL